MAAVTGHGACGSGNLPKAGAVTARKDGQQSRTRVCAAHVVVQSLTPVHSCARNGRSTSQNPCRAMTPSVYVVKPTYSARIPKTLSSSECSQHRAYFTFSVFYDSARGDGGWREEERPQKRLNCVASERASGYLPVIGRTAGRLTNQRTLPSGA